MAKFMRCTRSTKIGTPSTICLITLCSKIFKVHDLVLHMNWPDAAEKLKRGPKGEYYARICRIMYNVPLTKLSSKPLCHTMPNHNITKLLTHRTVPYHVRRNFACTRTKLNV